MTQWPSQLFVLGVHAKVLEVFLIWDDHFIVKVLASIAVRAVALGMICQTWFGFEIEMGLFAEFLLSMGKTALHR